MRIHYQLQLWHDKYQYRSNLQDSWWFWRKTFCLSSNYRHLSPCWANMLYTHWVYRMELWWICHWWLGFRGVLILGKKDNRIWVFARCLLLECTRLNFKNSAKWHMGVKDLSSLGWMEVHRIIYGWIQVQTCLLTSQSISFYQMGRQCMW